MKKLIALLLSVLLLCSLAACGEKKPADTQAQTEQETELQTVAQSEVILPEDVFD